MARSSQEGFPVYLTKLVIPLENRTAAEALGDCQKMHRLICSFFGTGRQEENLLYRIRVLRGSIQVYLCSEHPVEALPDTVRLAGQRDMTKWLNSFAANACFGFDILTCPCRKVHQAERDRNSQRRILREPGERMDWLNRKAEQNGFQIMDVRELEQSHSYGRRSSEKGGALHLDAYHYQGTLRITDPELFRKAVREGIGPEKAYGLGMLMLKKI